MHGVAIGLVVCTSANDTGVPATAGPLTTIVKRETERGLNAKGQAAAENAAVNCCGCDALNKRGTFTTHRVATPLARDVTVTSTEGGGGFDKMAAKLKTGLRPRLARFEALHVMTNCEVSSTCWLLTCQRQPAGPGFAAPIHSVT